MQSSKTSKNGLSEVPQKASPVTPPRKLKLPTSDSESGPSPNKPSRTPKDKSPKVVKRGSPRSPATEKKRPSKVSELETQLSQLQEELNKTKDQLTSSETTTKQAQEEAEKAKNDLAATTAELEASQKQLVKLSASEEARDEKLEATQNQHSNDLNNLRHELTETLSLVERLKCDISDCEKSESHALNLLTDTQVKLEMAKTVEENLRAEGLKAEEAYKSLAFELEKLKSLVEGENEGLEKLKLELIEAKAEGEKLKLALNSAEEENIQSTFVIRSAQEQMEQMKAELAIREVEMEAQLEKTRGEIEELKAKTVAYKENRNENYPELERAEAEIEELKAEIMAYKEAKNTNGAQLERAKGEIEKLKAEIIAYKEAKNENGVELERAKAEIEELKAEIMAYKGAGNGDKVEAELRKMEYENEKLKAEIEMEKDQAISLIEAAQASEREALMKVGYLTEQAEKSNRKAAYVSEELEAAQGTNADLEAELRRLKVQSDQWRKAAEAAAAMISSGRDGKLVERTGSLDKGGYNNTIGAKLSSPFSEDFEEELAKKKNGNVLRKFGFFGKKSQK